MFYVGNTFDEKANKGYKTIQNAKKAAEKDGLSVWDEEGVKLYPLKVEVTDDVPDDAALEEKPDGSVNAYDETGEKVGEVSAEEVKEIMDEITAEDVEAAAAAARRSSVSRCSTAPRNLRSTTAARSSTAACARSHPRSRRASRRRPCRRHSSSCAPVSSG